MRTLPLIAAALTALCLPTLPAQNCSKTSTGLVPLVGLGTNKYKGFTGGLYPGASNTMPAAHAAAGLAEAKLLQPLDAQGKPSSTGKIVLLSIGMSNTTQEWTAFEDLSRLVTSRNPDLVIVDGAIGGQDARIVADRSNDYWTKLHQRLQAAGVTPEQVQAFWLKEAVARPDTAWPAHAIELKDLLGTIVRLLRADFPNGRLCFLSSRIYAGYATTTLNPEPFAYESGFSVKWLIEQQIGGATELNWDPTKGKVVAPWLAWGPYLWSDGTKGGNGNLVWLCDDFSSDGTHPSYNGRFKVAQELDLFFGSSPFTQPWYFGPSTPAPAAWMLYGDTCRGSLGEPRTYVKGKPVIGNTTGFIVGADNIPQSTVAVSMIGLNNGFFQLAPRCDIVVDPFQIVFFHPIVVTQGKVEIIIPILNDKTAIGSRLFTQWLVLDPQGTWTALLGRLSLSRGVLVQAGL
ncbi:MAG: hypothetical protein R3F30_00485 [Planctomycetota bacterium]